MCRECLAARVNYLLSRRTDRFLFYRVGLLRPLFLKKRGLVVHVADERVHDRLREAEYRGAEDYAGNAEGVNSGDESDEHPVEIESLRRARGDLRTHDESRERRDGDADEKIGHSRRRLLPEDEQIDADGDVDEPLADERKEADEEDREREHDRERHAEDEVEYEDYDGLQRLVNHHGDERAAQSAADVLAQTVVEG